MHAVLFSGGKDSTLALHKVVEKGINIDLLITMQPESKESYMFHYPNVKYTELQAKALGIKHIFVFTKGEKEKELEDLERALIDNEVDLLVTGAVASKYQADRINMLCQKNKIEHIAPLWHIEPELELREIASKFYAIITMVAAEGLDTSFLGKKIDESMIEKLLYLNRKYGINLAFEGGEAESFVLDAPLFKYKININKAHIEKEGMRGIYVIDDAYLDKK